MRKYTKVSDSDVQEALTRIAEGSNPSLEAERLGVAPQTVRGWARGSYRTAPPPEPVNKIPDSTVIAVLTDYADGGEKADLCQRYGVSPASISNWIRGSSRKIPQELRERCKARAMQGLTQYPPETVEWALTMIETQGMSAAAVAREIGCTAMTVHNWRHGKTRNSTSTEADW